MDREYAEALALAKERLADARKRGDEAIGGDWDELEKELFSPEEIAASDARVAIMGEAVHAREAKIVSEQRLEDFNAGVESQQFADVLDVLAAMGKTLVVAPIGARQAIR